MLQRIRDLLGLGPKINYVELVKQGAIILDVRTHAEYASGHIAGSINIPVDQLGRNLTKLRDKNTPIITCCASGARSGTARRSLLGLGYSQVYNGGSWGALNYKIK